MNEKENEPEVQIVPPPTQDSAESIVQAMSQVILRDLRIVGIQNQNKNLQNAAMKKEEERKA